jgi:hypothetical protein
MHVLTDGDDGLRNLHRRSSARPTDSPKSSKCAGGPRAPTIFPRFEPSS